MEGFHQASSREIDTKVGPKLRIENIIHLPGVQDKPFKIHHYEREERFLRESNRGHNSLVAG
jgi:hypothetical protein